MLELKFIFLCAVTLMSFILLLKIACNLIMPQTCIKWNYLCADHLNRIGINITIFTASLCLPRLHHRLWVNNNGKCADGSLKISDRGNRRPVCAEINKDTDILIQIVLVLCNKALKKGCMVSLHNELHRAPASGLKNLLAQHAICCQCADMMAFPVSEQGCQ